MPRLNWIVAKHNGVFPAQEDMCMGQNGGGRTPVLALHAITHLRRTLGMDSVRICPPGATAGPGDLLAMIFTWVFGDFLEADAARADVLIANPSSSADHVRRLFPSAHVIPAGDCWLPNEPVDVSPLADWPHEFAQIVAQVSSGCNQHCPFCCWDRPLSRKAPEIAAGDIHRLRELYPATREKHVALLCNETTGCHDWLAAFCSALGTSVQWSSPANVRNATLEDLRLAKTHGLLCVNLGIETLDDRLLVSLHKGHTVEDAFRVFRWLRDLEIGYRFSLRQRIGETVAALDNTIAAMHRMHAEKLHPFAVTVGPMSQWPGNPRWPGIEPHGSEKYPRWLLPLAADRDQWAARWREIKRLTDELSQTNTPTRAGPS